MQIISNDKDSLPSSFLHSDYDPKLLSPGYSRHWSKIANFSHSSTCIKRTCRAWLSYNFIKRLVREN